MLKLNYSLKSVLKSTILKNKFIKNYYDDEYYKHIKKYSLDIILDTIIYVLKTGISWKNLINVNGNSIYYHFKRFLDYNIFKMAYNTILKQHLQNNNNFNCIIIDSSFIQNINGKQVIGRNKYNKNKNCTKLSLIIDESGFPLSIIIKAGNINDAKFIIYHKKHLHRITKNNNYKYFLADKGYDSAKIRTIINDNNIIPLIPKNKRNSKKEIIDDIKINNKYKKIYKKRIKIENLFCYLKKNRRINTRIDAKINSYMGFVYLAILKFFCKNN